MESWLPILITPTLTNGYDLPIKLSRVALKKTLQDPAVRHRLRLDYAEDAVALIALRGVGANHFATIATAHGYWRC